MCCGQGTSMEQSLSALRRALRPGSAQAPCQAALNVNQIPFYRPPLPSRNYRKTHNRSREIANEHVGIPHGSPTPLPNLIHYDNRATVLGVARTSTNSATAAS